MVQPRQSTKQPFVESTANYLGIGGLVERRGSLATIEYFRSPADEEPLRMQVPWDSLSQKTLLNQTRAYYRNPNTFKFEVGRILDY